ncbi:C40 family peptidase [Jeotgalibacillus salarius]|uniref:Peptidoglycan endopeptidase n=1 Tax=Jeotgalibacillus salarius TaxID=546023 RepID=A0A4Y8LG39_9BACL|nr:C40 family peptidase [Jeotgalibacillus salarius]TFE00547.1 peptidoglycan endopeptidase [Jeotgalibacillus salarius]
MKITAVMMTLAIIFSFAGFVAEAEESTSIYKVRSGDTLWSIATEHHTDVNTLKTLNHLPSNVIITNQVLKVPATSNGDIPETVRGSIYTVKSGDTLASIARKHETTVAELMETNHLSGNLILPGQQLSVSFDVNAPAAIDTYSISNSSRVQNVIDIAMIQLGIPYVWGGSAPDGFDCSGFVYYVFREAGLVISRTNAEDQHARSYAVNSPEPGDLVFFENTYKTGISHVGIYIGNDQFIHANDGDGVQITSLGNSYWQEKFEGFRRLR